MSAKDIQIPVLTNRRIVESQEGIVQCSSPEDQYNINLKQGLERGIDYLVISKEQWAFLESNYSNKEKLPTFPIKR